MTFDAIVIGGGPAGATASLLLARAGWAVVLLERKQFPRRKVCGEYLSATNLPLFDHLGIGERFRDLAGPAVRRVAVFAGSTATQADLPCPASARGSWGRALAREHLDAWLLAEAHAAGVHVLQPWTVDAIAHGPGLVQCQARSLQGGSALLRAPVVIAAHGSWEPGDLPTQPPRTPPRLSDLLAFKAHFRDCTLPDDLMPLLAFPGGYGGMVHTDGGRVSISCCIRRDHLHTLRGDPGSAGDAVQAHLQNSCLGVRRALDSATRVGAWLAAGPIRPGIRLRFGPGLFPIGNAAGEAHPIVAEGISMALQSAWLLTQELIAWHSQSGNRADLPRFADRYAARWRRAFTARLRTSAVLAHWAMRPALVAGTLPIITCFPHVMTSIARLTGKTVQVAGSFH